MRKIDSSNNPENFQFKKQEPRERGSRNRRRRQRRRQQQQRYQQMQRPTHAGNGFHTYKQEEDDEGCDEKRANRRQKMRWETESRGRAEKEEGKFEKGKDEKET